ncbi:MAG: hypothetical protein AVDCRST_MAG53-461, partial [uncultured Solirubrobacteraceae bacterium]
DPSLLRPAPRLARPVHRGRHHSPAHRPSGRPGDGRVRRADPAGRRGARCRRRRRRQVLVQVRPDRHGGAQGGHRQGEQV